MSAFFAFANSRRAALKREMQGASHGDISRALAKLWKGAPEALRRGYVVEEKEKRELYLAAMTEWTKTAEERKKTQVEEDLAQATMEGMDDGSIDYYDINRSIIRIFDPDRYVTGASGTQTVKPRLRTKVSDVFPTCAQAYGEEFGDAKTLMGDGQPDSYQQDAKHLLAVAGQPQPLCTLFGERKEVVISCVSFLAIHFCKPHPLRIA
jgi:hypothetical protein